MLSRFLQLSTKQLLILAAVLYLLAAFFNYGHNTGDEYSQIYEFAAYKLGYIPHSELRLWEHDHQMRPSLQIWLVYLVYKLVTMIAAPADAFVINYLIQASSALLSLAAAAYSIRILSPYFKPSYQQLFVILTLFTWLGIYTSLHFNSENISGKFYFLALLILLEHLRQPKLFKLIASGLFLSLAFACRFQIAFSALGVISWLIYQHKLTRREWLVLILVVSTGVAIFNLFVDHWFYGGWPLTAYNYYYHNIVTGTMNSYGTEPFYIYAPMLLGYLPWGPLYLIAGVWFCYRQPQHIFSWTLIPFVAIHSLIGHKEVRFLLPLISIMPFIITTWLQAWNWQQQRQRKPWLNLISKSVIYLNLAAYLVLTIPAATEIGGWKYIYTHYPTSTTIFYNATKDRKLLFYVRANVRIVPVTAKTAIHCPALGNCLYVLDADKYESNIPGKLVYSFFPTAANAYNYGNWMKNVGHFNVYQIRP